MINKERKQKLRGCREDNKKREIREITLTQRRAQRQKEDEGKEDGRRERVKNREERRRDDKGQ